MPVLSLPFSTRVDEALSIAMNDAVNAWIGDIGLFPARRDISVRSGFGTFGVLCHPDAADSERLLLACQWIALLLAIDDHYCDDESEGADAHRTPQRLDRLQAAMEEPATGLEYAPADVCWSAMRWFFGRLASFATPVQVARVRRETTSLCLGQASEASWRATGYVPTLAEYLSNRQTNGDLAALAMIDIVGGYEVSPAELDDPAVRRLTLLASNEVMYVNDIHSWVKEATTAAGDFNLITVLTAAGLSPPAALEEAVRIHDNVVDRYLDAEPGVLRSASTTLSHYVGGLRHWMAGNAIWSAGTARYNSAPELRPELSLPPR
jgi:2-methylisoborneol synthase